MILSICYLLEALSIVICLHYLYGEKFRLDVATVSFLSIDMIMMECIDYFKLPSEISMLIYLIIALYCGFRFGFKLKTLIINNILYMAIMSGVQCLVALVYHFAFNTQYFNGISILIINILAFLFVLLVLSRCKLNKISLYLQNKDIILILSLLISVFFTVMLLVKYKSIDRMAADSYTFLFIAVAFICALASLLEKYKIKSREVENELKMHQLYSDSFQGLIENIRLRQHEFDNHINTLYSQHYVHATYEELVNAQKEYCETLVKENRYNKLLTKGNPIIIGFLYGKFLEIDRSGSGIKISYRVDIGKMEVGVPINKLVEVMGDLINNAEEALEQYEGRKELFISVVEENVGFEIEVRNTSRFFDYGEIDAFFAKGYSKKGENRGLGLYNVKRICSEYQLDIVCENKQIDGENWLSFRVKNK